MRLQVEKQLSDTQNFSTNLADFLLISGSVESILVLSVFFLCALGPKPIHTLTYGECLVQPDVKRLILRVLASGPGSVPLVYSSL